MFVLRPVSLNISFIFGPSMTSDRSTKHPKFDPVAGQTHDSTFQVTEMPAVTTISDFTIWTILAEELGHPTKKYSLNGMK